MTNYENFKKNNIEGLLFLLLFNFERENRFDYLRSELLRNSAYQWKFDYQTQ